MIGLSLRGIDSRLLSITLDKPRGFLYVCALARSSTLENRSVSLLDKTGFVRLGESRRLYKGRV